MASPLHSSHQMAASSSPSRANSVPIKETTTPEARTTKSCTSSKTPTRPTLGETAISAAEQAGMYHSLGPVYAGVGIVGDISVEVGFQSGEGREQQRSGIGLFVRSDHISKRYVKLII